MKLLNRIFVLFFLSMTASNSYAGQVICTNGADCTELKKEIDPKIVAMPYDVVFATTSDGTSKSMNQPEAIDYCKNNKEVPQPSHLPNGLELLRFIDVISDHRIIQIFEIKNGTPATQFPLVNLGKDIDYVQVDIKDWSGYTQRPELDHIFWSSSTNQRVNWAGFQVDGSLGLGSFSPSQVKNPQQNKRDQAAVICWTERALD